VLAPGRVRRGPARARDAGSVTAETALALPVLLAVLAVALWVVTAVTAQLRCADAAAGAARAAARGDDAGDVAALARRLAPEGSAVTVEGRGEEVHVLVRATVGPPGLPLPGLPVRGRAVALREPG
jgi:Flp pilus assembly protein TadG